MHPCLDTHNGLYPNVNVPHTGTTQTGLIQSLWYVATLEPKWDGIHYTIVITATGLSLTLKFGKWWHNHIGSTYSNWMTSPSGPVIPLVYQQPILWLHKSEPCRFSLAFNLPWRGPSNRIRTYIPTWGQDYAHSNYGHPVTTWTDSSTNGTE